MLVTIYNIYQIIYILDFIIFIKLYFNTLITIVAQNKKYSQNISIIFSIHTRYF